MVGPRKDQLPILSIIALTCEAGVDGNIWRSKINHLAITSDHDNNILLFAHQAFKVSFDIIGKVPGVRKTG